MPAETFPGSEWLQARWEARPLAPFLAAYRAQGFAVVPSVVNEAGLEALRARADAIMDGRVDPTPFFFQPDPDAPETLRKVEKLERDPVFRRWLANPLFERIVQHVHARPVALYRAILMHKAPARGGTGGGSEVPWHQDGGALWGLDRNPELQIWTALDDAPREAGCLVVAAGSHRAGLASPLGGIVPAGVIAQARYPEVALPVRAGDVILIHNLAWHRSGRNATDAPRRAFSVCFLDGKTRCTRTRRTPRHFETIFA